MNAFSEYVYIDELQRSRLDSSIRFIFVLETESSVSSYLSSDPKFQEGLHPLTNQGTAVNICFLTMKLYEEQRSNKLQVDF